MFDGVCLLTEKVKNGQILMKFSGMWPCNGTVKEMIV